MQYVLSDMLNKYFIDRIAEIPSFCTGKKNQNRNIGLPFPAEIEIKK